MLYEILVLGDPSESALKALKAGISDILHHLSVADANLEWSINPDSLTPSIGKLVCAVFFASNNTQSVDVSPFVDLNVPIIPVVDIVENVSNQFPKELSELNCLSLDNDGMDMLIATTAASLGLMPEQRRVFISYRRIESTEVALQLYERFSRMRFNVFLDTYDILPAKPFQEILLHRLCESDVLLMLDTSEYFSSEWTTYEFGQANAKKVTILRIGWPDVERSEQTMGVVDNIDLQAADFTHSEKLIDDRLEQVATFLERGRNKGMAIRRSMTINTIKNAVERIGWQFDGVGANLQIEAKLNNGSMVALRPILSAPNAMDLQQADEVNRERKQVVMLYDNVGLTTVAGNHIDWLGKHINHIPWLTLHDLDKQLSDLEALQ